MRFIIGISCMLLLAGSSSATIIVAVKTSEYMVIGADGRGVDSTGVIVTDTYEKIVRLGKKACATCVGRAMFPQGSFKALMLDFAKKYNISDTSQCNVDSVVNLFMEYSQNNQKNPKGIMGSFFGFAGYNRLGKLDYLEYSPDTGEIPRHGNFNIYVNGEQAPTFRLLYGIDDELMTELKARIDSLLSKDIRSSVDQVFDSTVAGYDLLKNVNFNTWSLNDAIHYVSQMIDMTIAIDKMCRGIFSRHDDTRYPTTGGQKLICAINENGFCWILPPTYELK
jgi:hypothetical protein